MHEYLAPATLLIAILAGIWLNRRDVATLREKMNGKFASLRIEMTDRFAASRQETTARFEAIDRRLGVLEADYKQFYGMQQKLEGRVDVLQHGR